MASDHNRSAKTPTLATNHGEEEQQEHDLISSLPDAILHIILSKLEIRDAAVTTTVSKRWTPLFPTLPSLKIDAESFNPRYPDMPYDYDPYVESENQWVDALFSVLDARQAPVKKFEIGVEILDHCSDDFYKVFRCLCVSGIEELVIKSYDFEDLYRIPSPVFSSNTIVRLDFFNCNLVVPSKLTGLQGVKSLELVDVTVADDHLRRMISRCKAMEKLVICCCNKVKKIAIRAPSLSELVVSQTIPFAISLQNAPQMASVSVSFGYQTDDKESGGISSLDDSQKIFDRTSEATNLKAFLNKLRGIKNLRLNFSNAYRMILNKEMVLLPASLPPRCYLFELKKLCLSWPLYYGAFNVILYCLLNSSPNLMEIIICVDASHDYKNCPIHLVLDFWEKLLPPAECVN
ncbi:F-box/RNI-like superfamily protein [Rhynchospora pubera]|uniref:F-box/RNI-like superfamily protein n=1 Tax=Rhynchospora pubera TaxID=906938 RepID=A0AAV8EPT3_9POAL|nr:F-box/RNI-like superfamily protein [Rhynchospora pubera]